MRKAMLVLAVFGLASLAWAADPAVGTWKLNVAKSNVMSPCRSPVVELPAEIHGNNIKP